MFTLQKDENADLCSMVLTDEIVTKTRHTLTF